MERIQFTEGWKYGEKGGEKKTVILPHDASLEKGRHKSAASGRSGAYFESGCHEYEKTFDVPLSWENKEVYFEFEGVYPSAEVYLNDTKIGGCAYGYSLFRVQLKGLKIGEANTVRVIADDSNHPNSRWYAGAGIYRPVNLLIADKCHIKPDGVKITTKSYSPAVIQVDIELENAEPDVDVEITIRYQNDTVACVHGMYNEIAIPNACLWDAENPNLYQCEVALTQEGKEIDKVTENFGIRLIEYSAKGFFINGKSVLLKGGCIHSDNGILGAKSYAESEWRRVKRMKEFGFNAIRSSHNPLCKAALDACDTLGMYVMDETWDTWNKTKNPYDFGVGFEDRYETDVAQMIGKDYNHPSVIMYSIGNEVTEPAKKEGVLLGQKLIDTVKRYDATRPVTAGINLTLLFLAALPIDIMGQASANAEKQADENEARRQRGEDAANRMSSDKYNELVMKRGASMTKVAATPIADRISKKILDKLDIAGYNYAVSRYAKEGKKHKDRIVVGTETYCQDINTTWPLVEKYPYIIGDFMWTAWDYIGEVGIGSWTYDSESEGFDKNYPWILADTGAFDILGNDNAEAGLAAVVWGAFDKPYIAVTPVNKDINKVAKAIWRGSNALPHWSYRGCDGRECDVEVYSNASEVELYINGRCVSTQKVRNYKTIHRVKYESGELRAVAYDECGNKLSESVLYSANGGESVCALCEEKLTEDDILYYDIAIVGENGEIECNADKKLKVSVEGGELLGFGSANPKTEENYLSGEFTTYYGRAQAIVRKVTDNVELKVEIKE